MRCLPLLFVLFPLCIQAQFLTGHVHSTEGEPLIGAHVQWAASSVGTTTDEAGNFQIENSDEKYIVVSYVGYLTDTISIQENEQSISIEMQLEQFLEEVVVKAEQKGTYISNIDPIKTEVITQKELTRSACCDLAGCFNTQASVQPATTNIVTNSKELRILGLSGVYNQVLIDGFPLIQGLTYTYGISTIPGTMINTIFVAKGANSVLQGYESISGQINIVVRDAEKEDKLLANTYMNSFGEKQLNLNYTKVWDKWQTIVATHTMQAAKKVDRDEDNFLDLPIMDRYMLYNKWQYRNAAEWGWHAKLAARYVKEGRVGGQTFFNPETDRGSTNAYGQTVDFTQGEFYGKFGYRLDDYHHIVAFVSAFRQDQDSYYGTTHYKAQQNNLYSNLQYELNWKEKHSLKTGVSFRFQDINEDIDFGANDLGRTYAGNYQINDLTEGFFIENTFNWYDNKVTLMTGVRVDHHDEFGWKTTPRILLKANLSPFTTIRSSFGTGWRNVNLFSENVNLLASSRDVIFVEKLAAEEAMNYGLNLTHKIYGDQVETQLSFDFYRTTFNNQIFPDYFSDPTTAIISNFGGTSISNGFQAELGLAFFSRFGAKFAYNYLDVHQVLQGEKRVLPFNAKHRISTVLSYEPLNKKWQFDSNIHWTGVQTLAQTEEGTPSFSSPYTVVSAQVTRKFPSFEIYTGCENIFDFRQKQPIRSWENPFGPYFDTANVWGPTRGREWYLGFTYHLE